MWNNIKHNIMARGSLAAFAFGVGLLAERSIMIFTILGGIAVAVGIVIFIYNCKHPTDEMILSIHENAKKCKLIWGFWHTGENAKKVFQLGTINKVLLLEPNQQNKSFVDLLSQLDTSRKDVLDNINLTTESAIDYEIPVRWHNDPTVLSFMICDPSPSIEKDDVVNFSKKAYVVVQVADHNLITYDWSLYKKTNKNDRYAFEAYVKWFKDVWENKSKEVVVRGAINECE